MQKEILNSEKYRLISCFLITALFLFSLSLNAFCTSNDCIVGVNAFIMGSFGFLMFGADLMWLANPFFIVALILLFCGSKFSKYFSIISFCFSVGFLFFNQIIVNEAGDYYEIVSLGMGYWLWLLSSLLLFIAGLIFAKPIEWVDDQF